MSDTYVYLKNLQGVTIKPVTDLSAINLTTGDGIGVEGNTIGVVAGYVAQTAYTELTDPATAANPDSGYIEGGTMYTLLGGYAVTSDVPPATAASEYRVPSEKAVREAIDAYVATGGSDIVAGRGIDMGGGQINATEATVEETLKGYTVSGGTTTVPFDDQVVMPYDLRGALSLGQAVDVSCAPSPYYRGGYTAVAINGATYSLATDFDTFAKHYLDEFTLLDTTGVAGQHWTGWEQFPKAAAGLKYLALVDVRNAGDSAGQISCLMGPGPWAETVSAPPSELAAGRTTYTRLWVTYIAPVSGNFGGNISWWPGTQGNKCRLDIKNWRQYEVTTLTDEAISALATAPDPDAWFRANARSVNERYLIKPDMVSPWIPIIRMSTNSTALTVGAGLAYAVDVFGGSYTIGVDTFPEDAYGQDAHLELFVKAGSHVTFQPPLSLMDPLQENAGHNITIKFREGRATAYVDDTNYGYIIDVPEGTDGTQAGGSLYFAINGSTSNYAIFSAQLDGTTVTTANVTANKDLTLMGNGTDKTFISGTINVNNSNKMTIRSITVDGGNINGPIDLTDCVLADVTLSGYESVYGTVQIDGTLSGGGITVQNGGVLQGGTWNVSGGLLRQYGTIKDIVITGWTTSADNAGFYGDGTWENCEFTGNTNTGGNGTIFRTNYHMTFTNCYVHDNTLTANYFVITWNDITINGGTYNSAIGMASTLTADGKPQTTATLSGYVKGDVINLYRITNRRYNLHIISGATLSGQYATSTEDVNAISVGQFINGEWVEGGSFSYVLPNSDIATLSACRFSELQSSVGRIGSYGDSISVVAMDLWSADKAIFASPLDASAATTVKLTGTTFTGASLISKSPSQIQLPANSINSFSGNTTAAGTKILKAGTIIVGDDRTNPTGSATIEFVGGSTTLSGIGTYIAKDGTNDFVPIAGNVTSVTTATGTGAGSLQYALTSGTKYAKLANNLNASAGALTANGKTIVTSEYEPILCGSFSVATGGTMVMNEATKTTTINGAAITMSSVEIPAGATVATPGGLNVTSVGGAGVLDFSTARTEIYNGQTAIFDTCVLTGGNAGSVDRGVIRVVDGGTCILRSAYMNHMGGNDQGITGWNGCIFVHPNAQIVLSGTTVGDAQTINLYGATANIYGSNAIQGGLFTNFGYTINVTSGAILDFTGNSNAMPINRGANVSTGGITFAPGGATVYPSAGQASAYMLGGVTIKQLGNTNVINLAPGSIEVESGGTVVASNCTITGGTGTVPKTDSTGTIRIGGAMHVSAGATLQMTGCTVTANTAANGGGGFYMDGYDTCTFTNCVISGNGNSGDIRALGYCNLAFSGCNLGICYTAFLGTTASVAGNNKINVLGGNLGADSATQLATIVISSGASIMLGTRIDPGGTSHLIVRDGGCTVNGTSIAGGTYTQIISSGGSAVAS